MTDYKDKILEEFDKRFAIEQMADKWDYSELRNFDELGAYKSIKSFISDALTQAEERVAEKMGWEKIWCDDCGKVQPLLQDYMKKQLGNKYDAMDLVCGKCRIIIATLHKSKYLKKHE